MPLMGFGALLLLTAFAPVQDSARVGATLSSTTVRVGETVVLEVRVETDGPAPESIDLPRFPPALQIIGTRDYSQLQFSLPGGRSRIVRREVVLRAVAPGRTRIPPIDVDVDGGRYHTPSLTLSILDAAQAGAGTPGGRAAGGIARGGRVTGPRRGVNAPTRAPDGEVLLRTWLSPDTVYVGEQVTLRSEALFSEDARLWLRRAPEYEPPATSGFWIHELPDRRGLDSRIVDGRPYQVQAFRRAYFPLSAGRYTLPPAQLLYEIRRGFLAIPESHRLASDSLPLVVLPPPQAGRPATFTGAVGRFQASARIEPAGVPAGEAAVLTLEVRGEGNIKALPPPALPALPGVRVYPPSEESEVDVVDGQVRGVKRFRWVLIPSEPGQIGLPAIEYAYFDPAREAYAVARTGPLALDVRPTPDRLPGRADEEPAAALRPLESRPAGTPFDWVRSQGFAAIQLLPLLALLGILLTRRQAERGGPPSRRALRRRRRRALASLQPLADRAEPAFFGRFAESLRSWLAARVGDPSLRTMPPEAIARTLEDQGVAQETVYPLVELIASIEQAPYEPEPPAPVKCRVWLEDAERLLAALDQQAHRTRGKARTGAAAALLTAGMLGPASIAVAGDAGKVCPAFETGDAVPAFEAVIALRATGAGDALLATEARSTVPAHPARRALLAADARNGFSATEARNVFEIGLAAYAAGDAAKPGRAVTAAQTVAEADARAAFETGVAAYGAGEYPDAARAFADYVALRPRDSNGWYNLGNAYYRTGMAGSAAWAWLRAARLDPRDADVRHNLALSAATPELVRRATPAIPLSTEELLLLASLVWLGGVVGLGAWTLHRHRGFGLAGLAAVLFALALVSGWAAPRFDPATGVILEPQTPLLAAPTLRAEEITLLEAGGGVHVLATDEDWLRVRTPQGTHGWVESERVGLL